MRRFVLSSALSLFIGFTAISFISNVFGDGVNWWLSLQLLVVVGGAYIVAALLPAALFIKNKVPKSAVKKRIALSFMFAVILGAVVPFVLIHLSTGLLLVGFCAVPFFMALSFLICRLYYD